MVSDSLPEIFVLLHINFSIISVRSALQAQTEHVRLAQLAASSVSVHSVQHCVHTYMYMCTQIIYGAGISTTEITEMY